MILNLSIVRFALSGLSSFLIDNVVFPAILLIQGDGVGERIPIVALPLVVARLVSSNYNYLINRHLVSGAKGQQN